MDSYGNNSQDKDFMSNCRIDQLAVEGGHGQPEARFDVDEQLEVFDLGSLVDAQMLLDTHENRDSHWDHLRQEQSGLGFQAITGENARLTDQSVKEDNYGHWPRPSGSEVEPQLYIGGQDYVMISGTFGSKGRTLEDAVEQQEGSGLDACQHPDGAATWLEVTAKEQTEGITEPDEQPQVCNKRDFEVNENMTMDALNESAVDMPNEISEYAAKHQGLQESEPTTSASQAGLFQERERLVMERVEAGGFTSLETVVKMNILLASDNAGESSVQTSVRSPAEDIGSLQNFSLDCVESEQTETQNLHDEAFKGPSVSIDRDELCEDMGPSSPQPKESASLKEDPHMNMIANEHALGQSSGTSEKPGSLHGSDCTVHIFENLEVINDPVSQVAREKSNRLLDIRSVPVLSSSPVELREGKPVLVVGATIHACRETSPGLRTEACPTPSGMTSGVPSEYEAKVNGETGALDSEVLVKQNSENVQVLVLEVAGKDVIDPQSIQGPLVCALEPEGHVAGDVKASHVEDDIIGMEVEPQELRQGEDELHCMATELVPKTSSGNMLHVEKQIDSTTTSAIKMLSEGENSGSSTPQMRSPGSDQDGWAGQDAEDDRQRVCVNGTERLLNADPLPSHFVQENVAVEQSILPLETHHMLVKLDSVSSHHCGAYETLDNKASNASLWVSERNVTTFGVKNPGDDDSRRCVPGLVNADVSTVREMSEGIDDVKHVDYEGSAFSPRRLDPINSSHVVGVHLQGKEAQTEEPGDTISRVEVEPPAPSDDLSRREEILEVGIQENLDIKLEGNEVEKSRNVVTTVHDNKEKCSLPDELPFELDHVDIGQKDNKSKSPSGNNDLRSHSSAVNIEKTTVEDGVVPLDEGNLKGVTKAPIDDPSNKDDCLPLKGAIEVFSSDKAIDPETGDDSAELAAEAAVKDDAHDKDNMKTEEEGNRQSSEAVNAPVGIFYTEGSSDDGNNFGGVETKSLSVGEPSLSILNTSASHHNNKEQEKIAVIDPKGQVVGGNPGTMSNEDTAVKTTERTLSELTNATIPQPTATAACNMESAMPEPKASKGTPQAASSSVRSRKCRAREIDSHYDQVDIGGDSLQKQTSGGSGSKNGSRRRKKSPYGGESHKMPTEFDGALEGRDSQDLTWPTLASGKSGNEHTTASSFHQHDIVQTPSNLSKTAGVSNVRQQSALPDLNLAETLPNAFPSQSFSEPQQVQLRAQILVYGSLIQGTIPEEALMVAAFADTSGGSGRLLWEKSWRTAAAERVHNKVTQNIPREFDHSGVAVSTVAAVSLSSPNARIQDSLASKVQSSRQRGGGEASINKPPSRSSQPVIVNLPHTTGVVTAVRSSPSLHTDAQQASIRPFFPAPPVAPFMAGSAHWIPPNFPGQWVGYNSPAPFAHSQSAMCAPITHEAASSRKPAPLPKSDLTGISGLSTPVIGTASVAVTAAPADEGPLPKRSTAAHQMASSDSRLRRRKKSDAEQVHVLPSTSPASAAWCSPESWQSNSAKVSFSSPQVMPSTESLAMVVANTDLPNKSLETLAMALPSTSPVADRQLVSASVAQRGVLLSQQNLTSHLEQTRSSAEEASLLADLAVKESELMWSQLRTESGSGVISEKDRQLLSSAIAMKTAASVAKAAAAAAKVAWEAALQAKMMREEALRSSEGDHGGHSWANETVNNPSQVWKMPKTSDSMITSAKAASKKRLEEATAAVMRAQNLESVVRAAELATTAVSHVGAVVAMGDSVPFDLETILQAGKEGLYNLLAPGLLQDNQGAIQKSAFLQIADQSPALKSKGEESRKIGNTMQIAERTPSKVKDKEIAKKPHTSQIVDKSPSKGKDKDSAKMSNALQIEDKCSSKGKDREGAKKLKTLKIADKSPSKEKESPKKPPHKKKGSVSPLQRAAEKVNQSTHFHLEGLLDQPTNGSGNIAKQAVAPKAATGSLPHLNMNAPSHSASSVPSDMQMEKAPKAPVNQIARNSIVEVLSDEEGLRGVWFSARVLSVEDGKALVLYDELLSDDGPNPLEEWIDLEKGPGAMPRVRLAHPNTNVAIEGTRKRRREAMGHFAWSIGDHVDAWIRDGWWEGEILDIPDDGEGKVKLFFPGEGDTQVIKASKLRPSLVWCNGSWVLWTDMKQEINKHGDLAQGETPNPKRQKTEMAGPLNNLGARKPAGGNALEQAPDLSTVGVNRESGGDLPTIGSSAVSEADKIVNAKQGSRVVFGVPKPTKKRKFIEVSKHFTTAQSGLGHLPAIDLVKGDQFMETAAEFRIGSGNSSKADESKMNKRPPFNLQARPKKEPESAVVEVKHHALKKPRVPLRNPTTRQGCELGVTKSEIKVQRKEISASGGQPESQRPKTWGSTSSQLRENTKQPPNSVKDHERVSDSLKENENDLTHAVKKNEKERSDAKSAPEAWEPRRSVRRIQPTSRLLEGLQTASKLVKSTGSLGSRVPLKGSSSTVKLLTPSSLPPKE